MTPPVTPDPRLNRVSLPRAASFIGCPVGGYEGQATTCTNLQMHFMHHHVQDMIVIMYEGNFPQTYFPADDMFVSLAKLKCRYTFSDLCT